MKKRFAVLVSGTGTNMQALLKASRQGLIPADLCIVLSDRPGAKALAIAESEGVKTSVVEFSRFGSRDEFSEAVAAELLAHGAEFVCLAGFMRILSKPILDAYPNLVVNTHPSLLPAFPGVDAVKQALEYGVKVTGCTVHFIDEEVDHGPIIAQEAVSVLPSDDETSLHERIKAVEHRLYPMVARWLALDQIRVVGRRVEVEEVEKEG
jgi:phosphoribosylglycinamide formyltransferase-1